MLAASFLRSSLLRVINAVMLWPVHVQKVPQASEHLCPAKLQTRYDICCACQSICPFIHTDSGMPFYDFYIEVSADIACPTAFLLRVHHRACTLLGFISDSVSWHQFPSRMATFLSWRAAASHLVSVKLTPHCTRSSISSLNCTLLHASSRLTSAAKVCSFFWNTL